MATPEYLTLADLEAALGQGQVLKLLDHDGDGVADDTLVAAVLVAAEGFVEGHVSRVYPMATIHASPRAHEKVVSLAADIAAEYAWRRRPEFCTRDGSPNHLAYAETVKTLDKIAKGLFRLDVQGDPASPANSGGGPRYGTVDNIAPFRPFAKAGTGLF